MRNRNRGGDPPSPTMNVESSSSRVPNSLASITGLEITTVLTSRTSTIRRTTSSSSRIRRSSLERFSGTAPLIDHLLRFNSKGESTDKTSLRRFPVRRSSSLIPKKLPLTGSLRMVEVMGISECVDCQQNNIKHIHAYEELPLIASLRMVR
ncbi:uncharacterized protein [Spinacia oleracea]|uniref:Uncharacterized protein n=1 Tax=Spinacia oleracea TaxID=3562 RepID=A0ABM3RNM7_SPIOL|nr:uncharacterized protein LOC130470713 [Spinacia oleracea]